MKNFFLKLVATVVSMIPFVASAHQGFDRNTENGELTVAPLLLEEHAPSAFSIHSSPELHLRQKTAATNSGSIEYVHAVLTESGTLASVLGDRIYEIDSIAVEGPINDEDFNTLWDSSFNGHLKIINLEAATVENGVVPEQAFFHKDEQIDWETLTISTTWLRKLILPEGVVEIGDFAVAYATSLREIKLPSTLRAIGKAAFTDCVRLSAEQLNFPENLHRIGEQAFYQCHCLNGKLTLPQSLRIIMCAAFYRCHISDINFPSQLEYLGCMAFAGSRFEKALLPDDCMLCNQGGQFYNNWELTEAHLPDNLWFVPMDIFSGCMKLERVNIPSAALSIGEFAFHGTRITEIIFPKNLGSIDQNAFQGCDLSTIELPASLHSLGDRAFALCYNLKSIYCRATTPPAYVPAQGYESDGTPFAGINNIVPVYIPIGTKELYTSAPGWDYMTNFIETDNFPSAGIDGVTVGNPSSDQRTYDLQGREIETLVPGNIYIKNGTIFLQK